MSETTFRKNESDSLWYWHTQAANGDIVGDGGQGYATLDGARNGFLSQQGHSNWKPGDPLPQEFSETKVNENEYVVEH